MTKKTKQLTILSRDWALISAEQDEASAKREACAECELHRSCRTPFMHYYKPKKWTGRVLLLGEGPGKHEDHISGEPFTGQSGELVAEMWREAGLKDEDIVLHNAVRCRPLNNRTPNMKEIRACRPFVQDLIERLKPQYVFALGLTAAKSLLNTGSVGSLAGLRGKPLQVHNCKSIVYATYHPASILYGSAENRERIVEDFRRIAWKKLAWPIDGPVESTNVGFDTEYDTEPEYEIHDLAVASDRYTTRIDPSRVKHAPVLAGVKKLTGHSISNDIDALVKLDCTNKQLENWVRGLDIRDSFLITRLADENRGKGGYKLENLLRSFSNVKEWKSLTDEYGSQSSEWPEAERIKRCKLDAWASLVVADHFLPEARGPLVLTHQIAMSLRRIYHAGAFVDMVAFGKLMKGYEKDAKKLLSKILPIARRYGMKNFEPTNDNQIRELVYQKMKLKATRFTDGNKPKVDKLALTDFKKEHKYFDLQLAFNKVDKLLTTYGDGLRKSMKAAPVESVDGTPVMLLPTRINPLGARTGRRSSGSNPLEEEDESGTNYQNWPKSVRPIIRSRFRNGKISDNDYSKLEILLIAHAANEDRLMDYFLNSPNGYIQVGKELFQNEVEEGGEDYRATKSVVLGVNYNLKAYGMAHQLRDIAKVSFSSDWDSHLRQTEEILEKYHRMFPGIRRYQEEKKQEFHDTGRSQGYLGQIRRLPLPPEPDRSDKTAYRLWRSIVRHAENQAINFPIQQLASLVTGCGMLEVERNILREARMTYVEYHRALMEQDWPRFPLCINEIHDDLVYDCPPDRRKFYCELITETLTACKLVKQLVPEIRYLPLKVDSKLAIHWGEKVK